MILVLGGTGDSIRLANKLYHITDRLIFSTATDYGAGITGSKFEGTVISGQMDCDGLRFFCKKNNIHFIVDATHPYADNISNNAINVSAALDIKYYRYERPKSQVETDEAEALCDITYCRDYHEAGRLINKEKGNALVTTGSRHIEELIEEIEDIKRIYARILPKSEAIIKLEALGLMPEQIIAMIGPFTSEMNKLMLLQTKARFLVTKESGKEGKTDEKIKAAKELSIQSIIIQRPVIDYPFVSDNMDELVCLIKHDLLLNV